MPASTRGRPPPPSTRSVRQPLPLHREPTNDRRTPSSKFFSESTAVTSTEHWQKYRPHSAVPWVCHRRYFNSGTSSSYATLTPRYRGCQNALRPAGSGEKNGQRPAARRTQIRRETRTNNERPPFGSHVTWIEISRFHGCKTREQNSWPIHTQLLNVSLYIVPDDMHRMDRGRPRPNFLTKRAAYRQQTKQSILLLE